LGAKSSLATFKADESKFAVPLIWAGLLTLLIAVPWFVPGYLFGTDWPGPRHFPFPTDLANSAALRLALAALSVGIGAEWAAKLLVVGCLFGAAFTAYRAAPVGGVTARAVASTVYLVNPFVFGRLHYGQLFLLAGYAALPWVAIRTNDLLRNPSARGGLTAGLSLGLVGALDTHLFLVALLLFGVALVVRAESALTSGESMSRLAVGVLVAGLTSIAVASYWLLPIVRGTGSDAAIISGTGTGELAAYAAVPDGQLGLLPNLLGLYGFWAEATGRFTSMKAFVPIWPAVLAAILVVATVGAAAAIRKDRLLRGWAVALILAAVIGLILESGVSSSVTAGLTYWLDAHMTPYRGMRDAGKWAALLALVYSQFGAIGTATILGRLRERLRPADAAEWATTIAGGLLVASALYYGNGLLFGMHGEIKASTYPSGWYAADDALATDRSPGRTLFLPWHEYMTYSFVHNQNSVVASPAPGFFTVPIVISLDPEVPGIAPPATPDQVAVSGLVALGSEGKWAQVLAAHDIKYVLVARELDWKDYDFLDAQENLVKVGDWGSIVLYRNLLVA
jgi:hypothetical protein